MTAKKKGNQKEKCIVGLELEVLCSLTRFIGLFLGREGKKTTLGHSEHYA